MLCMNKLVAAVTLFFVDIECTVLCNWVVLILTVNEMKHKLMIFFLLFFVFLSILLIYQMKLDENNATNCNTWNTCQLFNIIQWTETLGVQHVLQR